MKKYLIVSISLLFVVTGRSESEMSPRPTPPEVTSENLLSWILSDENHKEYHTPESTIEEFNRLVGECITTEGRIMEGTEELSIALIEWFIPQLLAEHYDLRGREVVALIEKFGPPNRILTVREDINLESHEWLTIDVPLSFGSVLMDDGEDIPFQKRGPLECYKYDDFYIWIVGRDSFAKKADKVVAIRPRSPRYDQYINNLNIFEQQDD